MLLVDSRSLIEVSATPLEDPICSEKRKQISYFVFNEAITTENQLVDSIEREHNKNIVSETQIDLSVLSALIPEDF